MLKDSTPHPAKFFVGLQKEHTRAKGCMTLFVVGHSTEAEIEKRLSVINNDPRKQKITHVYFGARCSFAEFTDFDLLEKFLLRGYFVSLEVPAKDYADVESKLPKQMPEDVRFIVILSLPIPLANQQPKGTRITIKIDDTPERDCNPGVWCVPLQNILDNFEKNFTTFRDLDDYEVLP